MHLFDLFLSFAAFNVVLSALLSPAEPALADLNARAFTKKATAGGPTRITTTRATTSPTRAQTNVAISSTRRRIRTSTTSVVSGRTRTTSSTSSVVSGRTRTTSTTSSTRIRTTSSTSSSKSTRTTSSTTSSAASGTPTISSGKRGLSFNNPALTDYFSLSGQNSKVSWAYNWASDPYFGGNYAADSFNEALIYTPILWSNASSLTSIWSGNVNNAIANHRVDSVLAFNEPDECCSGCGGSCMTVRSAVTAYKQYVQPFAGKVKLGAPAVTNGVGSGIGIDWLDQFVGNCTSCRIDFIPLHWYGDVTNPDSFKSYVTSFYTKFKKPLWITEFGAPGASSAAIISFLENVMPWMDSTAYVQRYAYFGDFNAGDPYLLNSDNTLTDIGTVYNSYR